MEREIVLTLDGSSTLYLPELDEHYHSTGGAIDEAMHVFITAGFRYSTGMEPVIFEAGFGTGLNALLTAIESHRLGKKTEYVAIEKYPLPAETVSKMNYPGILGGDAAELYRALHEAPWNTRVEVDGRFSLTKIEGDITDQLPPVRADLIYFDAFAPSKQPELWKPEVLTRVAGLLSTGGIFVTYSAKGEVKRALRTAGMEIELLKGACGKRHMLRGVKI